MQVQWRKKSLVSAKEGKCERKSHPDAQFMNIIIYNYFILKFSIVHQDDLLTAILGGKAIFWNFFAKIFPENLHEFAYNLHKLEGDGLHEDFGVGRLGSLNSGVVGSLTTVSGGQWIGRMLPVRMFGVRKRDSRVETRMRRPGSLPGGFFFAGRRTERPGRR
jgi:hypothetical protein